MVVFCLALMFSQLDLGIINLLVTPIKRDLGINDFQMSLLLGFAFVVFYTFIGLPLSRFVDTKTRKYILAAGIAVWSVSTACCGLAQNFIQLFMARVMIGAGESINGPATYSMITDFFPPDKLARPFAVLQIGFISGQGLSLLLGAFVIQMLVSVPDRRGPGDRHDSELAARLLLHRAARPRRRGANDDRTRAAAARAADPGAAKDAADDRGGEVSARP